VTLRISVAVALPDRQEVIEVQVPEGATVREAMAAARIAERFPALLPGTVALGIWSRSCEMGTVLRDGDRVEVYRPLKADPKAMRRARARLKASSTRSRNEP
jgi:uncharacterized protein